MIGNLPKPPKVNIISEQRPEIVWAACGSCAVVGEWLTKCRNENCREGMPPEFESEGKWQKLMIRNVQTIAHYFQFPMARKPLLHPKDTCHFFWNKEDSWTKRIGFEIEISGRFIKAWKFESTNNGSVISSNREEIPVKDYNVIADLFKWLREE